MSDASTGKRPYCLQACRVLLLAHVGLALCAWWMLPQGFPLSSLRLVINFVLPLGFALAGIVALINAQRERFGLLQNALIGLAVGWTVLPLAAWGIFPVTGWRVAPRGLIAAGVLWLICGVAFRRWFQWTWRTPAVGGLALLLAILVPWSQKGPAPTTRVLFTAMPALPEGEIFSPQGVERLDKAVAVYAQDGSLSVDCGVKVNLQPLLTFESISPDRNWSILSPPELRERRPRRCTSGRRLDAGLALQYQEQQWMSITFDPAAGATHVAAWSQLDAPVYSHLNTFNELTITGHRRLLLSFSPCPEVRVEALPADYPAGRPARSAYLAADGTFRIVRAASGEKGPFAELGRGPLAPPNRWPSPCSTKTGQSVESHSSPGLRRRAPICRPQAAGACRRTRLSSSGKERPTRRPSASGWRWPPQRSAAAGTLSAMRLESTAMKSRSSRWQTIIDEVIRRFCSQGGPAALAVGLAVA